MISRRTLVQGMAALPAMALAPKRAGAATPPVFASDSVAISGHDAVAYFTEARHVAGRPDHALDWNGARWLFSRAANRDRFATDPVRYAPRYGGYCAFAMAHGAIAKTDPDAWTVHEGRLYLNFDLSVRAKWQRDIAGYIAKADRHWPGILNG